MKKLKIILQSNYFYLILIILIIFYLIYFINFKKYNSIYTNENNIIGIISNLKINEDNIKITLKSKEDIIVTYYYKDIEEINKLKLGIKIKVIGNLKIPSNNTIPNNFNYKNYLKNKKIYYLFTAKEIEVLNNNESLLYKIKNYLINRCNKIDKLGYIKSLVLGIKDIDEDIDNIYKVNGIMHLFAISGMHISLLSNMLLLLFNKFIKNKDLIIIIVIIFLIFYSLLIGFTPSVIRSLFMYILLKINKKFNFNISNLKILIIIIILMLLINPLYIFDIGFLYSITTSLGLVIFNKSLNNCNKIISLFKISLIANIFSLPITINNNYQINILTLIINIVIVPLISYIVYPLCLIVLIFPFMYFILKITIIILELISKLFYNFKLFIIIMPKMNNIIIFLYYLILLLIVVYNKKVLKFLLLSILIFNKYYHLLDNNTYIYFFDVGQGDSSLIITNNYQDIILIDTGGIYNNYYAISNIITFLKSKGITHLDNLILTHGDYDHLGNSIYLINNFKVNHVFFNHDNYNELELNLIKLLNKYNIPYTNNLKNLSIGNNKLYFINNNYYTNENDNSNIIYTTFNSYKLLFMGDASRKVEKDILKNYNLKNIDILKVGHHGSKTSSSKYFIDYINPKNSIISVGKNNLFGHPNKETLDNLSISNIYRTDIVGSVEIIINENGYKIRTYIP